MKTWLAAAVGLLGIAGRLAGEQVTVMVPNSISFQVSDVSATSVGGSVSVSFSAASLASGKALRIGVRAGAQSFSTSAGAAIAASAVTWTVSGASGGSGFNGTLSSGSYARVYQSASNPGSGGVTVTFRLAAPGGGVKAVEQSLGLEWLFESVSP